ncbi:DUF2288 domain-containing protein [Janthinobacterium sp. 17J80-10]|uniref:DUF2288 domain-containing protein n=1 Tax=Janthinobacterium sp. 17J80-10 TaxID=2497863 RepID=UPI0010059326|nr:DUF2288 domain-containing protein [Janthinobacterium sp. 17J80-10]QAU32757.1 DUF2288 domain-containing protein [Janthinobacterium sp. 17J80-10]
MTDPISQEDALRATLNGETARFAWTAMQRFFAAGNVIVVDDALDLVEVAVQIAQDNTAAVQQWMAAGQIGQVSDAQAQSWLEADAALWTVVVKPWVLVQQRAH